MKRILALVAVVAALGVFAPSSADARDHRHRHHYRPHYGHHHHHYGHHHRRHIGYAPGGYPIYSVYHIYSYDRWGNPIGRWITEPSYRYGARGYRVRPMVPLPPPGFSFHFRR